MTQGEFNNYLLFAVILCLIMATMNAWLVVKRGRNWSLAIALVFMACALNFYRVGAEKLWWGGAAACTFACILVDMVTRTANRTKENPKP
jgi:uncharacterized membrane protein